MNRNILKNYAPEARRDFIQAVTDRASYYGITKKKTEPVSIEGDVAVITGRAFPKKVGEQRKQLEQRVARQGFDQVMEAMAYTWFNRLVAIRFMELHGYLEHGYRVLSHPGGSTTPEILEHADSVDLPGLDPQVVIDLKLAGDKDAELYRMLLVGQCNALHSAMPFLFERIDDETELLLPDNLLHSDSLIRTLVETIPEDDWQEVEIIGWLYQFYISEKKDQVIGKVVKSEDIPAATQLFTPNWIVKYLVQNSLGRQWIATYPNSPLKGEMEYYIEPAEQTPDVEEQLKAITPNSLNPEELTLMDPAAGSGHILCEGYDLFKAIYLERGYPKRDIPRLILEKNLYGLEIDDRAAQLASLALMMKARADDRRIFAQGVQPHVLSIQESKGLDAREITEALNAPILKAELPPSGELFEEIAEEKSPLFSKKNLLVEGDISQAEVAHLIDLFEHGKTFGSLIQIPGALAVKLSAIAQRVEDVIAHGGMFEKGEARLLSPLVSQARYLSCQYGSVVTNPPYIGRKYLPPLLKGLLDEQFGDYANDVFSALIVRCGGLAQPTGHLGFMSPFTWMFISRHEELRHHLINSSTITSLIQLEYSGFAEATVPICTFTLTNTHTTGFTASFIRLSDFPGPEVQAPKTLEAIRNPSCNWFYTAPPDEFGRIPHSPLAYWVPSCVRDVFETATPLGELSTPRKGMVTRDNAAFIRAWWEVAISNIGFDIASRDESVASATRWFPYQKGGEFRNWYGNHDWVVDWERDGYRLLNMESLGYSGGSTNHNLEFIFQPALVWSKITSSRPSFRCSPTGFLFDDASGLCPVKKKKYQHFILGFLCSEVCFYLGKLINPTLNIQPGNMAVLPIQSPSNDIDDVVKEALALSKRDWDSCEVSWDFHRDPLLSEEHRGEPLQAASVSWARRCEERIRRMKEIEEQNNRFFIDLYRLDTELSPEVPDGQITFYRPNPEADIQRLVSYVVGCMMGRYSLDKPGLLYAGTGGEGFDSSQYKTFPADQDGIIPITEIEWFEDDAAQRLEKFIATAWQDEYLEENLKFVAESLGQKKNESARDTIRRYLSSGFYKHHLPLYKKRPIYWLFSSGKQRAFQCLVYLHRYNAGTLARMRTEYVIPLSGKIDSRIEQLTGDITAASSTAHQKKLTKERDTLIKHSEELQKFDEKLKHYADQRIELDLDDGVKVNYGKFGDLLAGVKSVCGKQN